MIDRGYKNPTRECTKVGFLLSIFLETCHILDHGTLCHIVDLAGNFDIFRFLILSDGEEGTWLHTTIWGTNIVFSFGEPSLE